MLPIVTVSGWYEFEFVPVGGTALTRHLSLYSWYRLNYTVNIDAAPIVTNSSLRLSVTIGECTALKMNQLFLFHYKNRMH